MRHKLYLALVVFLLLLNAVLRVPFRNSEVSGGDRPWMYQMAMRLWALNWVDFSRPLENAWVQIARFHGQAELLPMFLTVGLNRLLHIPQTAFNIQCTYVVLDTFLLLIVFFLAKRLSGSKIAGLMSGAMYATFPILAYVAMYPFQTNFTNLLLSLIILFVILYRERQTIVLALTLGGLSLLLQLSSRLAILDALFLLLIYSTLAISESHGNRRLSGTAARSNRMLFLAGISLGVLINALIYIAGKIHGLEIFGIYSYFFHIKVPLVKTVSLLENLRFLLTVVGYNGILLISVGLLVSFLYPWIIIKTKSFSIPRALVFCWFILYFPFTLIAQRLDYNEIYFIPMILMTADTFFLLFHNSSQKARKLFATAFTACIMVNLLWTCETVRNCQITTAPFRVARFIGGRPSAWKRLGLHPYFFSLSNLNNDYHLKATGYWIRKHSSAENSIVLLCGNSYFGRIAAEYYFGTPFATISRPSRKRLYYFDVAVAKKIADTDLDTARRCPEDFIGKHLFKKAYPLDGVSDFYVVFIHPKKEQKARGRLWPATRLGYNPGLKTVLDKKLFLSGEIRGTGSNIEISIYSFMPHDFIRYDEEDAKRAFKREFSTWEALWGNNYFAQWDLSPGENN